MGREEMRIDSVRAKALVEALTEVSAKVTAAASGRKVRLVAVSKLKPATDILALHQGQQEHFGENYAQELMEKAELLPKDIKWHFIGGLQSNKCKSLASQIPNLYLVSSVDTIKKATQLEAGRSSIDPAPSSPLNIHIQVNTSGEVSKSGTSPGFETLELAKHIIENCPHLNLLGLMTIGAIARSKATGEGAENEDFKNLRGEKDRLEKELGRDLELSMGMSEDFEGAISMGSGEVRVGSTIFGARPPRNEAVI
ncbi:hypothetical protein BJ878DRAFT_445988 [Calycina marina]|uniref:Pyridoxal phosphate homeostasis protein n=1 Tax=Calycina marina TaxID=1763456 RepID=A0A9P7YYQ7_9HELO|nr:hypothetical protein BJ878DRAFT_445988 [Calycina marina]